ncbi:MAG: tetratricopeptide repeat protein [Planctomycetaceae bacterium]|jgi:predicted CXXCH cytochrome family protein|nr:tetratricopeptide repeat protein [Planctomycetaceae bacterium]
MISILFCFLLFGGLVFLPEFCVADERAVRFPLQLPDKRYADPESCAKCHADLCSQWKGSDHAKSMNHASEQSVLGDFNNVVFLHIGFDDLLFLSSAEIKKLLGVLETSTPELNPRKEYLSDLTRNESGKHEIGNSSPKQRYNVAGRKMKALSGAGLEDLVTATFDAKRGIVERLRQNMSETQRQEFDDELLFQKALRFQRPGDIAVAQDKIVRVITQLVHDNSVTTKFGTPFRLFRDENKFMVETDIGTFEVRFTLGNRPLQQYLVETEGGRLQALPVAWDSVEKRWLHLYPKEQILKGDPLHWTTSLQNWNRMCADCHTTNLQKNFDPKTKEYRTTFTELHVGCQSCHGPCGKHVETAEKQGLIAGWKQDIPTEVFSLTNANGTQIVQSCVFCHARRRLLHEGAKPPETPAADWLIPESVDAPIYYPDGQLLEEAFEYGSFLQSKMHDKGVSCTNCHEPHSLELKFQGNRLCTQCHSPSIYDTVKHHFHPNSNNPGTQCVECHFPQSTYMVVDPRRDHSIRKPSPALTLTAGVPNACTICHRDRNKGETLEWARDHIDRWYAEKRKTAVGYSDLWPTDDHYALAIAAGRRDDPAAVQKLLKVVRDKGNKEFRPVIRAAAITLLSRIPTDQTAEEIFSVCADGLNDADSWVRFAALGALAAQPEHIKLKHLAPLLNDPVLAVRTETARVLARNALTLTEEGNLKKSFENAKQEYIAAQKVDNDQAATYLNLAVLEHDLAASKIDEVQRWLEASIQNAPASAVDEARKTALPLIDRLTATTLEYYRQSLEIDGDFLPSRINLAMLYHERGNDMAAEREFREALRIEPENGNTAYSLGLLLAELQRSEEAADMLRQASQHLETTTGQTATRNRVRYNLGLLLLQLKRHDEAEKELKDIIQSEPQNKTFLYALTVAYLQRNATSQASAILDRLIKLDPQNPQWQQWKTRLRSQQ